MQDFKALSFDQKLLNTHRSGVFLTVIKVSEHVIRLYAVGKFYVEVWYDTKKNDVDVMAFDNTDWLAAYAPDINIV